MGGRIYSLDCERQFVASRNILHYYVLIFDTRGFQGLFDASNQPVNDGAIPTSVNNGDAKVRAYRGKQDLIEEGVTIYRREVELPQGL